jgi:hypothetical protein
MKKVFKVRDDQIEIENVWIKLEENTIIERFPKITKIIFNRESQTDTPGSPDDILTIHNIDFKVFSKLKDLEELGIIEDFHSGGVFPDLEWSNNESTKVYLNFLEILKLKNLKKLYINTDFVSTKDLLKLFELRAGAQEKFIYQYNLNHPESDAEYPPMIYEDEFDQNSWDEYNELASENVESNLEIMLNEKDRSECTLVEVVIFRMREEADNKN